MAKKLEGKTAVITGGTEGIGLLRQSSSSKKAPMSSSRAAARRNSTTPWKAIGANVSGVQGDVAHLADLDRLLRDGCPATRVLQRLPATSVPWVAIL